MAKDNILINTSHNGAATCLSFAPDGSKIYTGGRDCLVRVWKADQGADQEPDIANESDEAITSITVSKEWWISASEDASVRQYSTSGVTLKGLITRSVGVAIRCVAIDPSGKQIAVTSDELEVKLIELIDTTNIKTLLGGHSQPVRKATWNPSGTILTTSGQDGRIVVWDVSSKKVDEEPKKLKVLDGILPEVDSESPAFANDCSAIWHPSGKYFVVLSRSHEITVISSDTWSKTSVFKDDDLSGESTALCISPNGLYLASASPAGICIWSTHSRNLVYRHKPESTEAIVSQISFSPLNNLLAWTDSDGNLTRWSDVIPSKLPDPFTKQSNGTVTNTKPSASSVAKPAPTKVRATMLEEDEMEGDDTDLMTGWIEDDLGVGFGETADHGADWDEKGFTREMVNITKAQPPFQPGSTPFKNRKCYLAMNNVGVIDVTDQPSSFHQIINVEFHDKSTFKSYHFTDSTYGFTMASLGERGALYASAGKSPDGSKTPSQLAYKPYASSNWGGSQPEWQVSLPTGENIVAIAAGGTPPTRSFRSGGSEEADEGGHGNLVVATDKGYIRFLTGSGIQTYVWFLGQDVVSMVAGREWVFVVHREGGTSLDGCQNLRYSLVALDTFDVIQEGRLPLPKTRTLQWIGISEEGAPAMYDSTGILSIMDRFRRPFQGRWVPILDTNTMARREGKDESYWPVSINGNQFMCVILKGQEQYPGFPRPVFMELDLAIPLIGMEFNQSQLEEKFLRQSMIVSMLRDSLTGTTLTNEEISRTELSLDKDLLQLIQLACKSEKIQRAIDTTKLIHHSQSLQMAAKIAGFYHMVGLKEKMEKLAAGRSNDRTRLEEERDNRKKWGSVSDPVPAPVELIQQSTSRRIDEAGSFTTARIPRKSLANATPIVTRSASAKLSVASNQPATVPSSNPAYASPMDTDPQAISQPLESGTKRKRDEQEEWDSESSSSSRKKAFQNTAASSKPFNPFARKVPAPGVAPPVRPSNPFSRNTAMTKSLVKSNTFFEKVDAVENIPPEKRTSAVKGKGKAEKDNTRQTTLFNLPPPPPVEKKLLKTSKAIKASASKTTKSQVNDQSSQAARLPVSEPATTCVNEFEEPSSQEQETQPTQIDDNMVETQVDFPDAAEFDSEQPFLESLQTNGEEEQGTFGASSMEVETTA